MNYATTITSSNSVISSGWYSPRNGTITVSGTYGETNKVRKKCVYCDCLNDTEYGTCKYCGAPLGVVAER